MGWLKSLHFQKHGRICLKRRLSEFNGKEYSVATEIDVQNEMEVIVGKRTRNLEARYWILKLPRTTAETAEALKFFYYFYFVNCSNSGS